MFGFVFVCVVFVCVVYVVCCSVLLWMCGCVLDPTPPLPTRIVLTALHPPHTDAPYISTADMEGSELSLCCDPRPALGTMLCLSQLPGMAWEVTRHSASNP